MRFFLFLLVLISSSAVAADVSEGGFPATLAPASGDLSVSLLASIFGVVDGVLHGTGSQILGTMFGLYNAAILTMGMVILVYVLLVGTLNTAHEGETLGKEWSSIWLPLRIVSGVALLLPKATGYSFIQIIVMWVVVQGVGVADLVWNRTLDYLGRGGVLVQPQTMVAAGAKVNFNGYLIPIAGTILKSETCMFALQNILANNRSDKTQPVRFLTSTLDVEQDPNNSYKRITYFPGKFDNGDGVNYKGMCGSVSWYVSADKIQTIVPTNVLATDSRSIAVQQMILNLQPQAQQLANKLIPVKNQSSLNFSLPINSVLQANSLFYTTADYIGIMTPYLQYRKQMNTTDSYRFIDESKRVGWIMAGAYYYDIAKLNVGTQVQDDENAVAASFPDLGCTSDTAGCQTASLRNAFAPVAAQLSSGPATCPPNVNNEINNFICAEIVRSLGDSQLNPNKPTSMTQPFQRGVKVETDLVANIFTLGIKGAVNNVKNVMSGMGDIYNAQSSYSGNPIILVTQVGITLVNAVESIWISGMAVLGLAVTAGSIIAFFFSPGIGQGLIAVVMWLLPFVTAILLPLLIAGATMAYYVPLIPYILFTFGALTWFAAVIEAMVAAPLVALGLAHPDGSHKQLGQAQYAVMLLANIFLRPVLMIFGFIGATILCSIMLWLVNYGFAKVWDPNYIQADTLGVVYFVATIVVYMTLVLTVINRSFALVYDIPNKVLRWVGGTVEQGGEGAALDEFKGGVTRGLESGGQMIGKVGEAATDAVGGIGKRAAGYMGGKGDKKDETNVDVT